MHITYIVENTLYILLRLVENSSNLMIQQITANQHASNIKCSPADFSCLVPTDRCNVKLNTRCCSVNLQIGNKLRILTNLSFRAQMQISFITYSVHLHLKHQVNSEKYTLMCSQDEVFECINTS